MTVMEAMIAGQDALRRVRFQTGSPYPDVPIFTAPEEGLVYAENYPFIAYTANPGRYDITLYLAEQVEILKFNNGWMTREDIRKVLSSRLIRWKYNWAVLKMYEEVPEIVDDAIVWSLDKLEDVRPIYSRRTTWYSDKIESLKGDEKKKAKAAARAERNAKEYREDIRNSSDRYRMYNYNVLPTIKHLDDDLDFSRTTIKTFGKDYYISTKDNSKARIRMARIAYPDASQSDIATVLGLSRATVNTHWK